MYKRVNFSEILHFQLTFCLFGASIYIKRACQSVVRGIYDLATKVEITHTLQKQIYGYWSDIETWSNTFYSWYGNLVSTRSNLSAGMFRLKTVAKVYCGNNYETITVYSSQVSSVG